MEKLLRQSSSACVISTRCIYEQSKLLLLIVSHAIEGFDLINMQIGNIEKCITSKILLQLKCLEEKHSGYFAIDKSKYSGYKRKT